MICIVLVVVVVDDMILRMDARTMVVLILTNQLLIFDYDRQCTISYLNRGIRRSRHSRHDRHADGLHK